MIDIEGMMAAIYIIRHMKNFYYICMAALSFIAIYMSCRMGFVRFCTYLWLFSGSICFLWELTLFLLGSRSYNHLELIELFYHAITEAGPGLIIMTLTAHKLGIIDISRYKDSGFTLRNTRGWRNGGGKRGHGT